MINLAVTGGTIITMDRERQVLIGGAVGILDGRIAQVEPDAAALGDARETVDTTGKIVLPGIVDTHGHAGHSLSHGIGEGWRKAAGRTSWRRSTSTRPIPGSGKPKAVSPRWNGSGSA